MRRYEVPRINRLASELEVEKILTPTHGSKDLVKPLKVDCFVERDGDIFVIHVSLFREACFQKSRPLLRDRRSQKILGLFRYFIRTQILGCAIAHQTLHIIHGDSVLAEELSV